MKTQFIGQTVQVGDCKINVETIGEGQDLIIIHGWVQSIETWRDVAIDLSRIYKVHLIDLPGFGKSLNVKHKCNITINGLANIVKEIIDIKGIQNPIIAGHSMGGQVVVELVKLGVIQPNKAIFISTHFQGVGILDSVARNKSLTRNTLQLIRKHKASFIIKIGYSFMVEYAHINPKLIESVMYCDEEIAVNLMEETTSYRTENMDILKGSTIIQGNKDIVVYRNDKNKLKEITNFNTVKSLHAPHITNKEELINIMLSREVVKDTPHVNVKVESTSYII